MSVALWVAAIALMLVGFAGLVLPVVPGAPLLFAGMFLAAWAEDFVYIGPWTLAVLAVMAVLTFVVDFAATAFGAKRFGASAKAAVGATIGAVVGMLAGVVGVLVGSFIGALIGELSVRRDLLAAGRAGVGAAVGLAIGAALKLALGVAMLGVFIVVRVVSQWQ